MFSFCLGLSSWEVFLACVQPGAVAGQCSVQEGWEPS